MLTKVRRSVISLLASTALASVTACSPSGSASVATGATGIVISSSQDQDLAPPVDRQTSSAPSLDALESEAAPSGSDIVPGAGIRDEAIHEAALAYGARGGLAYASQRIDSMLNADRAALDATWNIGPLEIVGPSGTRIIPPVITQRSAVYDQPDANTVVIANQQYEIVAPAKFSPTVPLWQTYLIMSWAAPSKPDYSVYPKTSDERAMWKAAVDEGWQAGETQAYDIFRTNLNRLQRDFVGMTTWATLVSEGKASSPIVAATLQGVTGGGNSMTLGQGTIRLTAPAQLLADPSDWKAPAVTQ